MCCIRRPKAQNQQRRQYRLVAVVITVELQPKPPSNCVDVQVLLYDTSLRLLQVKSAVIRGLRSQSGKARSLTKDLTRASSSCAEGTRFPTPSTVSGAYATSAISLTSYCPDISEHLSLPTPLLDCATRSIPSAGLFLSCEHPQLRFRQANRVENISTQLWITPKAVHEFVTR